jgi:uncharacterized protein
LDRQNQYTYSDLTAVELALDKKIEIGFKKIDAEVNLQKSSIGIRADFKVWYEAEFSCMRCLSIYNREYKVELHLDYVEGEDPYLKAENMEITAHDADKVYYRGPQIDLSIGIREAIILSQPIIHLCRDDCRGLCPFCGVNLNTKRCSCKTESVGIFSPEIENQADIRAKKSRRHSEKLHQ